ncbi:MAG: ROK family protein [Leptospiraceae bacterium]|nr:ROK family protein [Leptospiraceae bacterium]
MNTTAWLGIDLGGSNIQAYAFDDHYQSLGRHKVATMAREGYAAVLQRIADSILHFQTSLQEQGYHIAAIGLCVPGVIESGSERVRIAPNLGWEDVNPIQDLRQDLALDPGLPIVLINDVNAGLLGELAVREEQPHSAVACFCGTGVGGAVYMHGQLVQGFRGSAGEIGHVVVRAGGKGQDKGVRGSLEAYIGKWALNAKIKRALKKKTRTALRELINYDLDTVPIKSSSLKKAWHANDAFTHKLMSEYYSRYLGIALAQVNNLIEPELIILGGGIIEALGEELLPHIEKTMARHCIAEAASIQLAALGDLAGARGAAQYARESRKI